MQTKMALHGRDRRGDASACVIAYEPVWAIGTGLTATDEQANETIGVIRKAVDAEVRQAMPRTRCASSMAAA